MFNIGNMYNFSTLVPAILGLKYANATLSGIMSYRTALTFINPDLMQANLIALLPANTPSDQTKYTYYLFTLESGSQLVLADAWIDTATIMSASATSLTITVQNAGSSDAVTIKNALISLGYTDLSIVQNNA